MEAYCINCQGKKEIQNPRNVRKSGKPAVQGVCPTCGSIIFGMAGTSDDVKQPSSSAKPPIVTDIFERKHKTEDQLKSLGILQPSTHTFSLFSTREEVALSQGVPGSRTTYRLPDHYSFDWYGGTGGQIGWIPAVGSYFHTKSSGDSQNFVFVETNPFKKMGYHLCGNDKGYEVWTYGDSRVVFGTMPDCSCKDCGEINYVRAWANAGELRLTDFTITANNSGLNYGMQIEHVLQSQGNPSLIFPESWNHSRTVTLSSPPNEGAQILYYFNPNDLSQSNARSIASGHTTFCCKQEPSSIYIAPACQISADIEFAKEHGTCNLERVAQKVVSWTNNGHLKVSSSSEVALKKSNLDEESKKRFIDLMKLEELFNSMESPTSLTQNSKTILDDFLNQSSNLNTYEKGLKFEQFCKRILEAMGYEVEHSGQSGDRGIDLKAVDHDPIKGLTLVVQCKHQESVSADVVIQTFGMVNSENANKGLVITTGSFTADAKKFADETSAIEIIDGNKLADLVKQYLEA